VISDEAPLDGKEVEMQKRHGAVRHDLVGTPFNEEYLSVEQLAQRIPYKPRTIRNLIWRGVFLEGVHYTRLTGRPIFLWSRVQELLKEGRHGSDGTDRSPHADAAS
jgi:hypothetical protein